MKKLFAVIITALLMLSLLAGCASEGEVQGDVGDGGGEEGAVSGLVGEGKDISTESFKIAYVASDLGTVNNQKWDEGCRAALAPYANCTYTAWDCEGDSEKCNQILQELINQEYDGIFLHPVDASGQAGMVDACEAAGINVVTINLEVKTTYSAYCGRPDYATGVAVAHNIADMLGGSGNVVVIGPPVAMMETYERDDAFIETIEANYPDITILEEVCGDWSTESGNQITRDFITKYGSDSIDVVFCCNDSMAFGAVEALKASGMEGVLVVGSDGQDQAMEYIKSGDMAITLLQDSVYNAKIGTCILLELIQNGLNGGKLSQTPRIDLSVIQITSDNVDDYYTPAE